ncbi:hypothetical protein ACFFLS_18575 [Flavobacterium procerum]|uniref:Uncharacterized protein n=1 Tax=Flavobacterium procerum TaxID=1455569 RepID=A0ABV6BUE9_9FLAO
MKGFCILTVIAFKSIFLVLTFLFVGQIAIAQNSNDSLNDWDKIIIKDSHFAWSHFENDFQINRHDLWLTPLEKPDSIIKKVDSKQVSELVRLIGRRGVNDSISFEKPLISFGRDSLWLVSNAENLWKEYSKKKERLKEMDSIAINTIKDYKKANQAASSLEGAPSTDDYPFIMVLVIQKSDTLSVFSSGQNPYMLPWRTMKRNVYDSKISELVAALLPDHIPSNKERVSGRNFNNSFVKALYDSFLEDKENYLDARHKFPRTFKSLQKEFEITKAEIVDMASIEWEGKECLEMYLKDVKGSKNIQFNTISGVNELFSSKKSILRKKDYLINSLKENPVYKYTLSCDNCLGEIHWVKSKSLSAKAKNNFKEDLVENGIDKNKYDKLYKDAIFYELTEKRDSKSSFSRWIFLKNGTFILWQLQGNYLMNFPNDFFEKQGYICKEIKF